MTMEIRIETLEKESMFLSFSTGYDMKLFLLADSYDNVLTQDHLYTAYYHKSGNFHVINLSLEKFSHVKIS